MPGAALTDASFGCGGHLAELAAVLLVRRDGPLIASSGRSLDKNDDARHIFLSFV
jgi:hypothetical protein